MPDPTGLPIERFLERMRSHPLHDMLRLAVPIAILDLEERGGPTDTDLDWARAFAWELAEKADAMLFPATRASDRGAPARLFTATARAIAIGAFQPGGIKFDGDHYLSRARRTEWEERHASA